jgi:signal transduction histidine kinase/ActR/RegA family two-component response regulator
MAIEIAQGAFPASLRRGVFVLVSSVLAGAALAAWGPLRGRDVVSLVLVVGAALAIGWYAGRRSAWSLSRRFASVYAVSSALGKARTYQEIADAVLYQGVAALGATAATVFLMASPRGPLRRAARAPQDRPEDAPPWEVPLDAPLPLAHAARTGEAIFVESPKELDRRFPALRRARSYDVAPSWLCVPMMLQGQPIGVFAIGFPAPRRFDAQERAWAKTLAQDCAMAVERTRLFEAERRARLEAEEASRTKDAFLSVASHELRAPLTSIVGWAHLLKKIAFEDRARHAHGLEVIERSALAQARLVDDILDMSRIAAGKLRIDAKPLSASPMVRGCVDEVRPTAAARGLELEVVAEVEAVVLGDAERLRQVLLNVLSNALKFTPRGGHVRVVAEVRDGAYVVRVRDDGKGIPRNEIPHVFEAFHQVDSSAMRREGGLGLGLAIVKHIVREHRGSVRAESAGEGRGTTVTVEIPLAEPVAELVEPRSETRATARAAVLGGLRVLVVDDDADAGDTVAEILEEQGAQVKRAPSATAALIELREFSPNAIVSDIGMPEHDGYWLMRKVRALPTGMAMVPALALTSYSRPEDVRAAMAAGFHRHMAKPPEPRVLADALAQLCANAGC